jgi:hypothetical protein
MHHHLRLALLRNRFPVAICRRGGGSGSSSSRFGIALGLAIAHLHILVDISLGLDLAVILLVFIFTAAAVGLEILAAGLAGLVVFFRGGGWFDLHVVGAGHFGVGVGGVVRGLLGGCDGEFSFGVGEFAFEGGLEFDFFGAVGGTVVVEDVGFGLFGWVFGGC